MCFEIVEIKNQFGGRVDGGDATVGLGLTNG